MNKRINFEDNIFMLNARLALIRDLLSLDTDPILFLNKTMEDIEFIDYALTVLLGNLQENQRLLERDELFENLADTEWQFSQLLASLGKNPFALPAVQDTLFAEKLPPLQSRSEERRDSISQTIKEGEFPSSEPLVSSAELSELLKGF